MLDLRQVELLWSQNGAWACDSNPSNEGLCTDLVVLHRVNTDEGSSATETCLTVDCDGA